MDLFQERVICMITSDNAINTLLFPRMYFFVQSYIFIYKIYIINYILSI